MSGQITSAQGHFKSGHAPRGQHASGSKLTEAAAVEIIQRAASGEATIVLARQFSLNRTTIQRLLRCETWKHLPRPEGLPRLHSPPRSIRIEGDVAYVPLTRGLEAVIDASDVPLVEGRNWYASNRRKSVCYAIAKIYDGKKWAYFPMHRLILPPTADRPIADHIDGNGLNNRRSNLRLATHKENSYNLRARMRPRSGFKGVSMMPSGKWKAQLIVENKVRYLGCFVTPEEAARAFDKAAREVRGEFARLNFPTEASHDR